MSDPINAATAIITAAVRAYVHANAGIGTTRFGSPQLVGLAMAILADLQDAGWVLPTVEPTPPDPDRPGWHLPRPADAPAFYRDLDPLADLQYRRGTTARNWAVQEITCDLDVWSVVRAYRAEDPASCPGHHRDISIEAMATRLVGHLLDGGLTPPGEILPGLGQDVAS